jgi:hypothetical protein
MTVVVPRLAAGSRHRGFAQDDVVILFLDASGDRPSPLVSAATPLERSLKCCLCSPGVFVMAWSPRTVTEGD